MLKIEQIKVNGHAPKFKAAAVFDQEIGTITLADYFLKKYVLLFFYPLNFSFICPTEILSFSDKFQQFAKIDTEILGISIDSKFSHLAWLQIKRKNAGLGNLKYPLVSDLTKQISSKYNVLTKKGVALRGVFILDKQGILQYSSVNNLSVGRNIQEVLRVLKAIQYVQKNPNEGCPANWNVGKKTITLEMLKKFERQNYKYNSTVTALHLEVTKQFPIKENNLFRNKTNLNNKILIKKIYGQKHTY